jgi:hypothetical protein
MASRKNWKTRGKAKRDPEFSLIENILITHTSDGRKASCTLRKRYNSSSLLVKVSVSCSPKASLSVVTKPKL